MKTKKLLLIDGNSLFFKSFYASYKRLKDGYERAENGDPVNAIRLFAFMIVNLKKQFYDYQILVAFDARGVSTFRHKYEFYKANRKKQPDELYQQIPVAKEFLDLYGISWTEDTTYEADDIIGIYANYAKNLGYLVNIITADRDLLQLVDENVSVHLSKIGVTKLDSFTNDNFYKKFYGLSPLQVVDLKGLAGDSSDNIKGIHGIGEVTAIKLLKEYNQIENILFHIDELSPVLRNKMILGKENALLSKQLAKIIDEGDLDIDLTKLNINAWNREALVKFFKEKNIFNILKKFEGM